MMNRKRAFLPMLHSCFIFLILVLLFPNLAYSFPADFDGDGKNDFVVWRQPEAVWYVWPSTYSVSHNCPPNFEQIGPKGVYIGCKAQWGLPGDKVLSGNYDQDAKADLVVWRPSTQTWWIKFSVYDPAVVVSVPMGLPGDIPDEVNADVTDAVSDLILFRPNTFTWYVRSSIPPYNIRSYVGGRAQTGRVDPLYAASAIYDPNFNGTPNGPAYFSNAITNTNVSYGVWSIVLMETQNYYEKTLFPTTPSTTSFTPVIGNFGGQSLNKADYAMWNKNNGTWSLYYNGGIPNGVQTITIPWVLPGDIPLGGDYDGDGITDFTVWRGASSSGWEGTWFVKPSSGQCPAYMTPYSGGGCYKQWGLSGDIPVS